MSQQPPVPGHGPGADPAPGPRLPADLTGGPGPHRDRELGLGDFAHRGAGETCPPGPRLAAAVAGLSGPEWRCPSATDAELAGLLRRWADLESWAAAGKLGVIRELIRRRGLPGGAHGDLPDRWEDDLSHEIAPALAVSLPAADKLALTAWDLQARLPGIAAALADGAIDYLKASLICKELAVLDDAQAAQAEAMLLPELAGKPAGQIARLAALAVDTVDPDGSRKRREHAEREDARVRLWREHSGASALAAYGLPTDAALSASANIGQRAEQYKKARIMPGARMDQLRVLAFCDILNGISTEARIAQAHAEAQAQQAQPDGPSGDDDPGDGGPAERDSSAGSTSPDGPADSGTDSTGSAAATGTGDAGPVLPAKSNLTLPLATLLGLAERPGEAHGLGPLDPALARDLAAAAARSPHTEWCVTITDPTGMAIGHGCARPARKKKADSPPPASRDGPWTFTPCHDDPGPPGGYGTWALTLPGGRELTVKLGPIPVIECDHRHESRAYQPSDTLRHLVEIRDGTCTFPACSRHARGCDFEHAIPYDQGGRTCACNTGMRSRRCHKVKQSKGWTLTQPSPGWHQWTTPSGRTYIQGPMKYPA